MKNPADEPDNLTGRASRSIGGKVQGGGHMCRPAGRYQGPTGAAIAVKLTPVVAPVAEMLALAAVPRAPPLRSMFPEFDTVAEFTTVWLIEATCTGSIAAAFSIPAMLNEAPAPAAAIEAEDAVPISPLVLTIEAFEPMVIAPELITSCVITPNSLDPMTVPVPAISVTPTEAEAPRAEIEAESALPASPVTFSVTSSSAAVPTFTAPPVVFWTNWPTAPKLAPATLLPSAIDATDTEAEAPAPPMEAEAAGPFRAPTDSSTSLTSTVLALLMPRVPTLVPWVMSPKPTPAVTLPDPAM